jgi:hypothetical protein
VQAHAKGADMDTIAAFMVGAGHRAYFGMGGWSSGTSAGNAFGHWSPVFAEPLGNPTGDPVCVVPTMLSRRVALFFTYAWPVWAKKLYLAMV